MIHDTEHFEVHLLKECDKTDPEYNYGVFNKQYQVYDVQTASEAAAKMLCDQHNYDKQTRIRVEKEEKADATMSLLQFPEKPESTH